MDASLMRQSALLIPAYQPDDRLPPYVEALKSAGVGKIIVVDDGSGDKFQPLFGSILQDEVTHVISYTPNGGKGHAMREGMRYLLDHCPEQRFIITADSDGQHTVRDVLRMIESLSENHEGLLLGSRDFSQENVPFKSRNGNRITSAVFKLLYGVWVSDTQTGLRGFERSLLPLMIDVKGERYEYEMNVLIECAQKHIPMRALPIETVYENNNEGSHFRAFRDSARIYGVILGGFFRFISSSVISFLVDYLLYLLLNNLFIFLFDPNQGTTLYGTRTVLCHLFWRYDLTAEQLFYMINISLKYFVALPVAILFISATDPSEFAASLNSIGISYKVGYSVAIALRYIPDIQRDYHSISQAQQARGVELGKSEPFFARLKNSVSILLPLILTSLNRIDTISNAMELRGFGKNGKRTWYTQRPFAKRDFAALAFGAALLLVSLFVTIRYGRFYNPFV